MQTTSSKALRSPAEEKPLSQKYLITEHFLPVRRMNTTLGAAIGAPLPPSVSHTGPCSALSCLRSFLPGRRPAPGGQSPSFLLVLVTLCMLLTPGPGTPRSPATGGWQRRGAGVGTAPELGGTCGFPWPLPLQGPQWGGDRGAPTLQQAQYFQQSSSSRTGNRRRKMSRGMSHQKVPGGHSREERGGGGSRCHPPTRV